MKGHCFVMCMALRCKVHGKVHKGAWHAGGSHNMHFIDSQCFNALSNPVQ